MGDHILPGIVIRWVHPQCSETEVKDFLKIYLGKNVKYRNGKVNLEIMRNTGVKQSNATVVVMGILLPFYKICSRLFRKILAGRPVMDVQPHFGIQIGSDGKFKDSHRQQRLHDALLLAKGFAPPINLIAKDFLLNQVGLNVIPNHVLHFDASKTDLKTSFLKNCLFFNNLLAGKSGKPLVPGVFKTYTEIRFLFRLETFQAMCMLNLNPNFCKQNKAFVFPGSEETETGEVKLVEIHCKVKPMKGIGAQQTYLNVTRLMDEYGYIPKEMLNMALFNQKFLEEKFYAVCYYCDKAYKIIGIDADFGWIAGRCLCDEQRLQLREEHAFTKLVPIQPELRILNKFLGDDRMGQVSLVQLVEGVSPLYESVEEFQRGPMRAAKIEHTYVSFCMMTLHHCHGTIKSILEIDSDATKKHKPRRLFVAKIAVPMTKFWCEANFLQIGFTNLKIPKHGLSHRKKLSYSELKQDNIPGRLYEIEDNTNDGEKTCMLTSVLCLSEEKVLEKDMNVIVIPKPRDADIKSLKRIIPKWSKRVIENKQKGPLTSAKISRAIVDNSGKFPEKNSRPWLILLLLQDEKIFTDINSLIRKVYIGVDVFTWVDFRGERKKTRLTGRVYGVRKNFPRKDFISINVIVKLHEALVLKPGTDAELDFWGIIPNTACEEEEKSPESVVPRQTVVPDEDLLSDAGFVDEDVDDLSNEDKDEDVECTTASMDYNPISTSLWLYKQPARESPIIITAEIFTPWRERPLETTFDLNNYFLYPDGVRIRHDKEPLFYEPMLDSTKEIKRQEILEMLNMPQRQAIEKIVNSKLSVVLGPPGSGKTSTGALAVCYLHCLERGVIVVASSSNFATDVIYEKIKKYSGSDSVDVRMKIMRMYATSREYNNDNETDMNILHHAMKAHPRWKADEMKDIVEAYENNGMAAFPMETKQRLLQHIRAVQMDILRRQDVILCTIGCSGDGRLRSLAKSLYHQRRHIIGLFLDEASLMRIPNTVLALSCGASRVVLMGDFLQLPPCVSSYTAAYAGLGISWMEMLTITPFFQDHDVFTMLNVQYRMHPQICRVVSAMTYDENLKTDPIVTHRNMSIYKDIFKLFPEFTSKNRISFNTYDKANQEHRHHGSGSFFNMAEVVIVSDILLKIRDAGVPLELVSIISMYQAQVDKISEAVALHGCTGVQLGTVDSFQGKESGIVILSLVRNNNKGNIGFLSDQRRINVSISRAKDFLFLVGDATLLKSRDFNFWITFFNKLNEENVPFITHSPEINEDDASSESVDENTVHLNRVQYGLWDAMEKLSMW